MNAKELFLKDGKSAGVYYCLKCKLVHKLIESAEECCKPYKCQDCGKVAPRYHVRCKQCANIHTENVRFQLAEKLTSFDGEVYFGDTFYPDLDYVMDELSEDPPEYVWATKPVNFVSIRTDRITEMAVDEDEAYEDFDCDEILGVDELTAAIEAFNLANKHHVSYVPDYTKAVIIDKEDCK